MTSAAPDANRPGLPTESSPAPPGRPEHPYFPAAHAAPYLGRLAAANSLLFLLPFVVVWLLILLSTNLSDTFGSLDDFRPVRDIRAAIGVPGTEHAPPGFPLLRDLTSIYLISVILLTIPVTHRQWQLMSHVIEDLEASGGLRPRPAAEYTTRHRLLGARRAISTRVDAGLSPRDALILAAQSKLHRIGKLTPLLLIGSFMTSLLVALGQNRNGLYEAFTRPHPGRSAADMAQLAYAGWWGSIEHPGNFVAYYGALALGVYIVFVQNSVGLTSVWTLQALTAVYDFDLDFKNVDGNYGWASVSRTYRTVVVSLAMHGSALALVLAAFGADNVPWTISMVAVWVIMLPSVTLGPLLALRRINEVAQTRRIAYLIEHRGVDDDTLRAQIDGTRRCKAYPLRITRFEFPAFFIAILLPVALTAAQIYFS